MECVGGLAQMGYCSIPANPDPLDYSSPMHRSPVSAHCSRPTLRLAAAAVALMVGATAALAAQPDETKPERGLTSAMAEVVVKALGLVGVPYRFGGNSPATGLDCSGLVRYVYANTLGMDLPRRSAEISKVGTPIDLAELKPGDLLFYNTLRSAYSHVAIYIGEGRFVHAPSRGKKVQIEDMSLAYWAKRFNGARRIAAGEAGKDFEPLSDLIDQLRAGATVASRSEPERE